MKLLKKRWPILFYILFPACGESLIDTGGVESNDSNSSESGEDTGGTDGESGGEDGESDPSQAPRILDADIWCYEHNTGEIRYYWSMRALAQDPQGEDTLLTVYDGLTVRQGNEPIAAYPVVCTSTGSCTASFEEVEDSVLCSMASSYSFLLKVTDEEGNISAPYAMTGRIGTNASGQ